MQYWLMKSEPHVYSINDLKRDGETHWDGVRNYQARNFMRDQMRVGDKVLYYHSNAKTIGVVGVARVCRESYPDFTAWDPEDKHYDPKSPESDPRWFMVDIAFVEAFSNVVSLKTLKETQELEGMYVTRRGMRLSVQPVEEEHFHRVVEMGRSS